MKKNIFSVLKLGSIALLTCALGTSCSINDSESLPDRNVEPVKQVNADKQDVSQYIGLTFSGEDIANLPGNLEDLGGWLIYQNSENLDSIEIYGIHLFLREENLLIFLGEKIAQNPDGTAVWNIIDSTVVSANNLSLSPTHSGDYEVQGNCAIADRPDAEIIAIAKHDGKTQYSTDILQAWRANRTTKKLESISTDSIKCEDRGWGV